VPRIAVLLPVLDERVWIDACLESLAAQEGVGSFEIVVADGGSTDGTLERLAEWQRRLPGLRVIANPDRAQSSGINRAAHLTDAEVLVRADAHTTYAPDYLAVSLRALAETGAVAVGGPLRPEGTTRFGRAVAGAFTTPLAIGPAPFHHATARRPADTEYLGTFRRADFLAAGGLRSLPWRVAEDADLYWRWRREGRTVVLDPAIRSTYRPRETPAALWRQFYRYGAGKADMLYVNGRWPSWRPLGPLVLVLGLAAGLAFLPWAWWPLAGLATLWMGTLAVAVRGRPLVLAAAAIMHLAYGLGLLRGLLRRPSAVRAQVEGHRSQVPGRKPE
jgi:succinoglycan biosynthesis protein ExoA